MTGIDPFSSNVEGGGFDQNALLLEKSKQILLPLVKNMSSAGSYKHSSEILYVCLESIKWPPFSG